MQRPTPPLLELGFYFSDRSDYVALEQVVASLAHGGAQLSGTIHVQRGANVRATPFCGADDLPTASVALTSRAELHQQLLWPDQRVISVGMRGALPSTDEPAEVALLPISERARYIDQHPISIALSGRRLRNPAEVGRGTAADARLGLQVYRLFRQLVEELRPTYATLAIERRLRSPIDLREQPDPLLFHDCFVQQQLLATRDAETLARLFADAHREVLADGLYLSGTQYFNPQGVSVQHSARCEYSLHISKVVGLSAGRMRHGTLLP